MFRNMPARLYKPRGRPNLAAAFVPLPTCPASLSQLSVANLTNN